MTEQIAVKLRGLSQAETRWLKAFGSIVFCALTFLAAQVRIPLPFTPIPMTLQTLVAPLAGAFLGVGWGAVSMLLYVALGFACMHVFAVAPGGWSFFLAPSAGYVLGFLLAAVVLGWAKDRATGRLPLLLALILSHLLIFGCGVAGLMINAQMTAVQALAAGVAPFVLGDVLKIAASFLILVGLRPAK